jgi:hypothetical protein
VRGVVAASHTADERRRWRGRSGGNRDPEDAAEYADVDLDTSVVAVEDGVPRLLSRRAGPVVAGQRPGRGRFVLIESSA